MSSGLPLSESIRYFPWEPNAVEDTVVQFRLIYEGRLPAESRSSSSSSRVADKMEARRQFHKQLKELLQQDEFLKDRFYRPGSALGDRGRNLVEVRSENFSRCGYQFVPIITEYDGDACALDILFLRRDGPGSLVKSGGDIDNRVKVLFDSLRMPQECTEVPDEPQEGETPFFCLLQDDKLIAEVKVTSDRLIRPQGPDEAVHDVVLVIHVSTILMDPRKKPGYFAGPLA